ncbi:MAG: ATPase, T2SS/T4P/T4SS family, partial [Planctomycetota bacterium]
MANLAGFNRKVVTLMTRHELIAQEDLEVLVQRSGKERVSVASLLVSEEYISELDLLGLIAEDSGLPPIDLGKIQIDMDDLMELNRGEEIIREDDAKKLNILPVALIGQHLTMAVANPYDVLTLDDIKLATGKNLLPVVSTERAIQNAIESVYHGKQKALENFIDTLNHDEDEVTFTESNAEDEEGTDDLLAEAGEGSPAVKLANRLILEAIQKKASDIHIEPFERRMRVRFRIDGVLHEAMS